MLYRQIGDQHNGGYRLPLSPWQRLLRPLWRWRLNQALRIADMRGQPEVIASLHSALREKSPMYLDEWRKTNREVGDVVDDLHDLMQWLRDEKQYEQADRLRAIMARLARSVPREFGSEPRLTRNIARTYK